MHIYKLKAGDTKPALLATLRRKKTESDLVQAATSTTITLHSSASATDDEYNSGIIQIVSGTGAGQVRYVKDYVGATKVATLSESWDTVPDGSSVYRITWTKRISDSLTGATVSVNFYALDDDEAHTGDVVTLAGSVVDDTLKTVQYEPSSADWSDLDTTTNYDFEIEVTYAGGDVETFPTEGYERATIYADLD